MKTYLIDSFTDVMFKGNPAGVCMVNSELTDDLMQSVAMKLNLPETAFLRDIQDDEYVIRFL